MLTSGGMFTRILQAAAQRHYPLCGIEEAPWSSVSKEQRIIDTLEPVLNQHRLIVSPQVIVDDYESTTKYDGEHGPEYRLFYQLARMVRQKGALRHDDRLDALAMAVAHFLKSLSRDTDQAVQDHKEAQLDAELEKFMQHALGGSPKQARKWASKAARKAAPRASK